MLYIECCSHERIVQVDHLIVPLKFCAITRLVHPYMNYTKICVTHPEIGDGDVLSDDDVEVHVVVETRYWFVSSPERAFAKEDQS